MGEPWKSLDEALYEVSGGLIKKGTALPKPDEKKRRLIRARMQAMMVREQDLERRGLDAHGHPFRRYADTRDEELEMLFASSRKDG